MFFFIKRFFNNLFICLSERDRKKRLRRSGYIISKPQDFHNNYYSINQRYPPFGCKVYHKYGNTYSIEDINYYIEMKKIYPQLKLSELYK